VVTRPAASSLTSRPSRSGWTWAWGKAGQYIILIFVILNSTELYTVLRIRDGDPGSEFFHSESRVKKIPDSGSRGKKIPDPGSRGKKIPDPGYAAKNLRIFNPKNCL
jgi:hypothetical protein